MALHAKRHAPKFGEVGNERKVLVVDDDTAMRRLLETAFGRQGYAVITVESAEEALDVLSRESVSVMFIDLDLPGMNGFELCERIRSDHPDAFIYALSGFAGFFGEELIKNAGFDAHFAKIPKLDDLYRAAEEAFAKRDEAGDGQIKRVLIVDDEPLVRLTLRAMLESGGFEVAEADSGEEAVRLYSEQPFDLVITDLFMPGHMEGLETMVEINRQDPRARFLAISGSTWYGIDAELGFASALGALTLKKPIRKAELMEAIERLR